MGSRRDASCAIFILIVLFFNVVTCTMHFWANLQSDVGSFISNAWSSMIDEIKRPVRIRRLGRTGKTRKPISKYTTEPVLISVREEIQPTSAPFNHRSAKLIIPFLVTPQWKSMLDWKRQRHGIEWGNQNRLETYRFVTYDRTQDGKITTEDDIKDFGNLFFV